jgi:hypothetical protein
MYDMPILNNGLKAGLTGIDTQFFFVAYLQFFVFVSNAFLGVGECYNLYSFCVFITRSTFGGGGGEGGEERKVSRFSYVWEESEPFFMLALYTPY